MQLPEFDGVISKLNEILNQEKYKGVKLDEKGPKTSQTLTLIISAQSTKQKNWVLCNNIAEALNESLCIKNKPRYKCMCSTNSDSTFYIHFVDLY